MTESHLQFWLTQLFLQKDERALCEYAKKLAYFDAYYHKFEFDMLRESSCCGLMSSQDAGIKNLGHFLGTLRQIYESEVARLSATFAIDTERNKYSRKMDYQKMAEGVESVIGAFVWLRNLEKLAKNVNFHRIQ